MDKLTLGLLFGAIAGTVGGYLIGICQAAWNLRGGRSFRSNVRTIITGGGGGGPQEPL